MRSSHWSLPDRLLAVAVTLLAASTYLPWARNPWDPTLGLAADEYVTVTGVFPARLVVLVPVLCYLIARRAGADARTETALLVTASFGTIGVPATHLVAANAAGWPARLGVRYYFVATLFSLWVLVLAYRLVEVDSPVERWVIVVGGVACLGFAAAHVTDIALSRGDFVPALGFYLPMLTAPVFAAVAALKYVEHATGVKWGTRVDAGDRRDGRVTAGDPGVSTRDERSGERT